MNNNKDTNSAKSAEKESKDNAIRLRFLFENMSSGVIIYQVINNGDCGKDYIIQDINEAGILIEGKEKSEILGKRLCDIRPNIDQYGLIPVFQEVWKKGTPLNFPSKVYKDSNFCSWYENRVYKLPSGEIVAIYNDVTENMLANAKLVESEQKYRQLAENISDVIWTTDLNLKTTYISLSAEKMYGEPIQDYMNRTMDEKFTPDSLKKIYSIIMEEFEIEKDPKQDKKRSRMVEVEHYRANGTTIWLAMNVSFIRDNNGQAIGFQGVTRDITERKQAEDSLKKSEKNIAVILKTHRMLFLFLMKMDSILK